MFIRFTRKEPVSCTGIFWAGGAYQEDKAISCTDFVWADGIYQEDIKTPNDHAENHIIPYYWRKRLRYDTQSDHL